MEQRGKKQAKILIHILLAYYFVRYLLENLFRFNVNKKTGVITVALCVSPGKTPCLDFESKPVYFLTYKVHFILLIANFLYTLVFFTREV